MALPKMSDVLTIPNAISAVGLVLTVHGSRRADTGRGITETVIGRLLDLVDGKVARKLNQSSEFGAGIDAAFDKVGVLAIGINEWRGGIAPKPALLVIGLQNAINLAATAVAKQFGGEEDLAPVGAGKAAMAYQNGALGAYAVSALFRRQNPLVSVIFRVIGHTDTVIGTGWFGVRASRQYISRAVELAKAAR